LTDQAFHNNGDTAQENVKGRVGNEHLAASQALLPVYEAIVNSIDAIG